jgi:hypothetical protein
MWTLVDRLGRSFDEVEGHRAACRKCLQGGSLALHPDSRIPRRENGVDPVSSMKRWMVPVVEEWEGDQ